MKGLVPENELVKFYYGKFNNSYKTTRKADIEADHLSYNTIENGRCYILGLLSQELMIDYFSINNNYEGEYISL